MQFPIIDSDSIYIKVSPNKKKDVYEGTLADGTLKISLQAAPENGKANQALLDFLKQETHTEWRIGSGSRSVRKLLRKITSL